jgi:hypothetical protein
MYWIAVYRRSGSMCLDSTFLAFFALAAFLVRAGSKLRSTASSV